MKYWKAISMLIIASLILYPLYIAFAVRRSTPIIDSPRIDKNKISILIEKSKCRLTVYYDKKPTKTYPIVSGISPNDKLQEGDNCTPEGEFKVRDLYPSARLDKFIWIDYPDQESWKKFREAQREGKVKPDANIGGEIGIHGWYFSDILVALRLNLTAGCVEMNNSDLDELYALTEKGTRIKIVH